MTKNIEDFGIVFGRYVDARTGVVSRDWATLDPESGIVLIGPPGTGKTNWFISNAARMRRPIICDDTKGEPTAILGPLALKRGGLRVVNPFDLHVKTHPFLKDTGWNAVGSLSPGQVYYPDDCRNTVIAINPRHGQPGQGAFFDNGATNFLTPILQDLRTSYDDANIGDLRDLASLPFGTNPNGQAIGSLKLMQRLALSEDPSIAAKAAPFTIASKANQDIHGTVAELMADFDSPALRNSMKGPPIDWAVVKNSSPMVSLITPSSQQLNTKGWRRLWYASAARDLLRAPYTGEYPPPMLFIDEMPQLGRMNELMSMAATARGHNLRWVIICQDLSQLAEVYGAPAWETFITSASAVCSFAPSSLFTAEYLSKLCGPKTIIGRQASQNNTGYNITSGFNDRPLIPPHELMRMPRGRMLVMIERRPPFFVQVENYWEAPYAKDLAPNPYRPQGRAR